MVTFLIWCRGGVIGRRGIGRDGCGVVWRVSCRGGMCPFTSDVRRRVRAARLASNVRTDGTDEGDWLMATTTVEGKIDRVFYDGKGAEIVETFTISGKEATKRWAAFFDQPHGLPVGSSVKV